MSYSDVDYDNNEAAVSSAQTRLVDVVHEQPPTLEYLRKRFSLVGSIQNSGLNSYSTFSTTPREDYSPLLVFANYKSGGKRVETLVNTVVEELDLHKDQLVILGAQNPAHSIDKFQNSRPTLLVMGGDGSISWLLQEIDRVCKNRGYPSFSPPVIVLPFGTGNDLAKTLGFGTSCTDWKHVYSSLQCIDYKHPKKSIVNLDRWRVQLSTGHDNSNIQQGSVIAYVMNCYFSIGCDARVALKFHNLREKNPNSHNSRFINKLWYAKHSLMSTCSNVRLKEHVNLIVDGKQVELPSNLQSLVVLNIDTYAGGTRPWPTGTKLKDKNTTKALDDGVLEIFGYNSLIHMGLSQMGFPTVIRIAQGSSIQMELKSNIPAQVDGEPFMQEACRIDITHYKRNKFYKIKRSRRFGCCTYT